MNWNEPTTATDAVTLLWAADIWKEWGFHPAAVLIDGSGTDI